MEDKLSMVTDRISKFVTLKEQFKNDLAISGRIDHMISTSLMEKVALEKEHARALRFEACAAKRKDLVDFFEAEEAKRFLSNLDLCCEDAPCDGNCLYCQIMKLKKGGASADDIRLLIGF